jgi:prepilin-type N-terminal cleavage/methylation domain-containing protein
MARPSGFTIVEVLVALVVFALGVLGMAAETAALTRLLARGRRAAAVTAAAAGRLERLRSGACLERRDGADTLARGSAALATLRWTWSAAPATDSSYRVELIAVPAPASRPLGAAETLRAEIPCEP